MRYAIEGRTLLQPKTNHERSKNRSLLNPNPSAPPVRKWSGTSRNAPHLSLIYLVRYAIANAPY
ncbi:hypothetical protein H6G48_05340 [Microcystis flos-aquae FACHB-1344]|uniref:Uncharacterized protein n=1 Tax=Microcystis flos-aquae FACHB-1344 TaxID=2692899 RepID=A0ABR8HRG6_9CHRO|nr:hypothetical protein [Microcystis flos-aquae]MBD2621139.1 hypothetical protein [Microcystis flos-aquae FACHB-1344]